MKNFLQLREFDPLSNQECVEQGIYESDKCKIELFNKKQKKQIIEIRRDGIKATSYVGIFNVGRKTIQILPKISKDASGDYTVKNLLYMLSYTKKIRIAEAQISKLCEKKKADFFEIIVYLFAKNLLELLKKNFRKNYKETEENLSFIKGRILFHENLKINLRRKDRIYCDYSDFSDNILLNQIFKYTSWLLTNVTMDPENYRLLRQLEFILSDISFKRIEPIDFDILYLDRLTYCYKPLVDLAKLFILNSTVELNNDKLATFSFLFDMDQLFEEFIAEFMIRHKNELIQGESDVTYHDITKYLIDSPERLFRLEPDIIVTSDNRKLIIDTKYKLLDPDDKKKLGISQPDLYQVIAYGLKHNCSNISLLYPAHLLTSTTKEPYIVRYDGKEIRIYIRTIDLNIDLQTDKARKQLKDQLRELVNTCIS